MAWALWALAIGTLGVNWWQDRLLRQAGRPDLAPLGGGVVAPILAAVSAARSKRRTLVSLPSYAAHAKHAGMDAL